MGTTTRGLRYPEPTDRVADGADAIAALADDTDLALPVDRSGVLGTTGNVAAGATVDVSAVLAALPARAGKLLVTARVDLRQNTVTTGGGSCELRLLLAGSTKDSVTCFAPQTSVATSVRNSHTLVGQLVVAAGATPALLIRAINAAGSGIALVDSVSYQALWIPA